MKIVIAPNSFKGSLTAAEAARAMERGIRRVCPEAKVSLIPMADGGEGFVEAVLLATGGRMETAQVLNPLGEPIEAHYGICEDGDTAVIEMAAASGLTLIPPEKRNPLLTTTYGTGELIRSALDAGCHKILVGIGGSATTDGGAGMAQALGVRFVGPGNKALNEPLAGGRLNEIERIQMAGLDTRIEESDIVVACDVENPLLGPRGAARIYAPQKGATSEQVELLEQNLAHFARLIARDVGRDLSTIRGAGAAGGLGAGLMAFCGATLKSGIELIMETVQFEKQLEGANLVLTGEGRTDAQTVSGKAPWGVAQAAKRFGTPVVVLTGEIGEGAEQLHQHGIDVIYPIVASPMTREEAMAGSREMLTAATERLFRILRMKGGRLFH
jgi:glycerate kinase